MSDSTPRSNARKTRGTPHATVSARRQSSIGAQPYPSGRPGPERGSGGASSERGHYVAGHAGVLEELGPNENLSVWSNCINFKLKAWFFRNMTIPDGARPKALKGIPDHQLHHFKVTVYVGIWENDWFRTFVQEAVKQHDANTSANTKYEDFSPEQIRQFWCHGLRWNVTIAERLFISLADVIDITAAFAHDRWNRYMKRVFVVACNATAKLFPASAKSSNQWVRNPGRIRKIIEAAPDKHAPNRPNVEEVPVTRSVIRNHGPGDLDEFTWSADEAED